MLKLSKVLGLSGMSKEMVPFIGIADESEAVPRSKVVELHGVFGSKSSRVEWVLISLEASESFDDL